MKKLRLQIMFQMAAFLLITAVMNGQTLKLYDKNPNYLEYKGEPLLIISASEHYGSVFNLDFDYLRHLETLKSSGLNFAKFFMGLWRLPEKNVFHITESSFITREGRHATPFAEINGKYDLSQWNPVFFDRLHKMVSEAEKRDIIVEATLFCSYYDQASWETSPFYFKNSVNGLDSIDYKRVHTLFNGNLWPFQEKMVRKIVRELNQYANCYFEIQNEPWSDNPNLQAYVNLENDSVYTAKWQKMVEIANDASLAWQRKISAVIVDEESKLCQKHLIAQNIGNFSPVITNPDPNVSIFNFHYALPTAASQNLHLKKVMALDETGFMPKADFNYRREAWQFVLGGGGIYNHLDYSFLPGKEDGTHEIIDLTPGWGGANNRKQLKFLKDFMMGFDFAKMKPLQGIVSAENPQTITYTLGREGKQYALYIIQLFDTEIKINIPSGRYTVAFFNPVTGETVKRLIAESTNGVIGLTNPVSSTELVISIKKILNN